MCSTTVHPLSVMQSVLGFAFALHGMYVYSRICVGLADICLLCSTGEFAPGADAESGRYSALGSLPAVPSLHAAMHQYHTQSEVCPCV